MTYSTEERRQIEKYIKRESDLVEIEREEEMKRHEKEINNLSGKRRQEKGRAVLNIKGKDDGEDLAGYLVRFTKHKTGQKLPENEISVGDLVMISKDDPTRDDNPTGTVIEKSNYAITVAFDGRPDGFVYGKELRMDLYVNDITFQRMLDAIDKLNKPRGRLSELRDFIIGIKEPEKPKKAEVENWHNENLDDSQKQAVKRALGAEDIYLIHGPPGTGKTTTVIEVIEQYIERGRSVLATADSNAAVDNIVEFLADRDVGVVRVGHPARVTKVLREHTLDSLIQEKRDYEEARRLKEKAFDLKDEQKSHVFPSGKNRRGLSNSKIKRFADSGKSSRGLSPKKIRGMAKWIELQEQANELFKKADFYESRAVDEVLEEMDVVCTTNSTAGSELMQDQDFDILVLDEATQATEPSCLIPITLSDEVIMAGDHKQLPPTIKSEKAKEKGLGFTLFEKLAKREGDDFMDMLRIQYRMNDKIMMFPSNSFYDGKLKSALDVGGRDLYDLGFDHSKVNTKYIDILDPDEPIVFLDTKNVKAPERSRPGSYSKENNLEANLSKKITKNALVGGLDPGDIAVISPYDDQVDLIREKIEEENVEVRTVDGFQGREKELVVISLVRSNNRRSIGFLSDLRRLNVSITRAKRKLIVIGDSKTVSVNKTYKDFISYIDEEGLRVELPI